MTSTDAVTKASNKHTGPNRDRELYELLEEETTAVQTATEPRGEVHVNGYSVLR